LQTSFKRSAPGKSFVVSQGKIREDKPGQILSGETRWSIKYESAGAAKPIQVERSQSELPKVKNHAKTFRSHDVQEGPMPAKREIKRPAFYCQKVV